MSSYLRRGLLRTALLLVVGLPRQRIAAKTAAIRKPVEHQVRIAAASFHPEDLKIRAGDSVVWTNDDIVPHTATARDSSWGTGLLNAGQRKEVRFDSAGSVEYFCRLHPSMVATIQIL